MEVQTQQTTTEKISMAVIAATGWFAVVFQFYLRLGSTANFFSFFTVECNLLIVLSLTIQLFAPNSGPGRFLATPSVQTAIAVYIVIVALVYNTVLRGLVLLEGMGLVLDTLLHVVMPALYYIYWFVFVPKRSLKWKDGLPWMWFPAIYLMYSLVRGSVTHWYPYPFLNAEKLGYPSVFTNIAVMIFVFFIGSLIMIAIKRDNGQTVKEQMRSSGL